MSVYLSTMSPRQITSANYITAVSPMLHPDRILQEHDFLYIIDGTWEISEENEKWTLHSDDLLILPAGRHHFGTRLCSPNNRHMYIHVIPSSEEAFANLPVNAHTDDDALPPGDPVPAHPLSAFHSLIHCQGNPRIKGLFEEIIAKYWDSSPLREEKLSLLLNLLFCELLEQQEKPVLTGVSRNIVGDAARLIQTTPQTFFTGKELADRFFVCERTLSNQFKKVYGKTLYAYQMDIKLEMVRHFLLTQPDVKLHEVALNFGFCDEFHLSRTFSKKYGVSPSSYRAANRL